MTTRTQLAGRLARDLGLLAQDAGWLVTPDGDQTEGSYTDPIDDGLAAVELTDLTTATAAQVTQVRRAAMSAALERLEVHYTAMVDLKVGQRDEKLSQISAALRRLRAANQATADDAGTPFTAGWVRDDGYGELS